MKEFITKASGKLSKLILKEYPELTFSAVSKALKNKDIKLNGVRTNKDIQVLENTKISVFIDFEKLNSKIARVYEDDNILVVFKPYGIEVVGNDNDLVNILAREGEKVKPCHRIDVNTEGLVILAKNDKSESIILDAFKNHKVKKCYTAWVIGHMSKNFQTLKAYLLKDDKLSHVKIFDKKVNGAKEIITSYTVKEDLNTTSILNVEIFTGRTHQIRAHLSHIGHAIVGDDKYGNREENKKFGLKFQALTSTEISLNLSNSPLSYLSGKIFKASPTWIKYLDKDR